MIRVKNLNFEEYDLIEPKNKLGFTNTHGGKITSRRSAIKDEMEFNLVNDKKLILKKIGNVKQ